MVGGISNETRIRFGCLILGLLCIVASFFGGGGGSSFFSSPVSKGKTITRSTSSAASLMDQHAATIRRLSSKQPEKVGGEESKEESGSGSVRRDSTQLQAKDPSTLAAVQAPPFTSSAAVLMSTNSMVFSSEDPFAKGDPFPERTTRREESQALISWEEFDAIPPRFQPRGAAPNPIRFPPCTDDDDLADQEYYRWAAAPGEVLHQDKFPCGTKLVAYNSTLWRTIRRNRWVLNIYTPEGLRYYWKHLRSFNESSRKRFKEISPLDPADLHATEKYERSETDPLDPSHTQRDTWTYPIVFSNAKQPPRLPRSSTPVPPAAFSENGESPLPMKPPGLVINGPVRKFKYGIVFHSGCTGNVFHQFMDLIFGMMDAIVRRGWDKELDQIAFLASVPSGGTTKERPGCPGKHFRMPYGYEDDTLAGWAIKRVFNIPMKDFFNRWFVVNELNSPSDQFKSFRKVYTQGWTGSLEIGELTFDFPLVCTYPLFPSYHLPMKKDQQPYSDLGRMLRPYFRAYDNIRYEPYCMHLQRIVADRLAYHVNRELGAEKPPGPMRHILFQNRKKASTRRLLNYRDMKLMIDGVLETERKRLEEEETGIESFASKVRKDNIDEPNDTSEGKHKRETLVTSVNSPPYARESRSPRLNLTMRETDFNGEPQNQRFRYINETAIYLTARGAGNLYSLLLPPGSVFIMLTPMFSGSPDDRIQSDSFPWIPYNGLLENVTYINVNCLPVESTCKKWRGINDEWKFIKWGNPCHLECNATAVAGAVQMAIDIIHNIHREEWEPLLEPGSLGSRYFLLPTEIREDRYEYYKKGIDIHSFPYAPRVSQEVKDSLSYTPVGSQ